MLPRAGLLALILVVTGMQAAGAACDPNETCATCILQNPMGGCIERGNDPICEARKAACLAGSNGSAAPTLVHPRSLQSSVPVQGEGPPDAPDSSRHTSSPLRDKFLKYDYAETKDLAKSFLTLVSALLVFSLTFSEKVIGFPNARSFPRICLIASWALFIFSIIFCGVSLCLISLAGGNALYGGDYLPLAVNAWFCLLIAGSFFALGLVILIVAAAASMSKQPGKDRHVPYLERRITTNRR